MKRGHEFPCRVAKEWVDLELGTAEGESSEKFRRLHVGDLRLMRVRQSWRRCASANRGKCVAWRDQIRAACQARRVNCRPCPLLRRRKEAFLLCLVNNTRRSIRKYLGNKFPGNRCRDKCPAPCRNIRKRLRSAGNTRRCLILRALLLRVIRRRHLETSRTRRVHSTQPRRSIRRHRNIRPRRSSLVHRCRARRSFRCPPNIKEASRRRRLPRLRRILARIRRLRSIRQLRSIHKCPALRSPAACSTLLRRKLRECRSIPARFLLRIRRCRAHRNILRRRNRPLLRLRRHSAAYLHRLPLLPRSRLPARHNRNPPRVPVSSAPAARLQEPFFPERPRRIARPPWICGPCPAARRSREHRRSLKKKS